MAFVVFAAFGGAAGASSTGSKLQAAKDRLAYLESRIGAENHQLAALQKDMNRLATRIDGATGEYQATQLTVMNTRDALGRVRDRYAAVRSRLDARAAQAYMQGAGNDLEMILGSTSFSDFADRLEYLNSVTLHDSDLADSVQTLAEQLDARKAALSKVLASEAVVVRRYDNAQTQLDLHFQQEQSLRDDLASKQAEVQSIVNRLQAKLDAQAQARALALAQQQQPGAMVDIKDNPLHTCPVGQPRAFGDSFGAPRYTTTPPHPHAGNDIMSPEGTPIYAPFDGVATEDPNGLGGNAVIVRGADGWVYNAHLVRYGTLGNVTAGTIIGYVGNTGDAAGGPTHDHFEWHPNVLPSPLYTSSYGYSDIDGAVDPYPYLLQVCP